MRDAMKLTHAKSKTELLNLSLANLVQHEMYQELKSLAGTVPDLKIDLNVLRQRR